MIEKILKDMVQNNTTSYLTDAGKRFVGSMKDRNNIKNLLVDSGSFFDVLKV